MKWKFVSAGNWSGDVFEPVGDVFEPVEDVFEPVGDVFEPVGDVSEPVEDVFEPVGDVSEPAWDGESGLDGEAVLSLIESLMIFFWLSWETATTLE